MLILGLPTKTIFNKKYININFTMFFETLQQVSKVQGIELKLATITLRLATVKPEILVLWIFFCTFNV